MRVFLSAAHVLQRATTTGVLVSHAHSQHLRQRVSLHAAETPATRSAAAFKARLKWRAWHELTFTCAIVTGGTAHVTVQPQRATAGRSSPAWNCSALVRLSRFGRGNACLKHIGCSAADLAWVHVHGHKNSRDENGKWIIAALVPTATDYGRCISLNVFIYLRDWHGGGEQIRRTGRLAVD